MFKVRLFQQSLPPKVLVLHLAVCLHCRPRAAVFLGRPQGRLANIRHNRRSIRTRWSDHTRLISATRFSSQVCFESLLYMPERFCTEIVHGTGRGCLITEPVWIHRFRSFALFFEITTTATRIGLVRHVFLPSLRPV